MTNAMLPVPTLTAAAQSIRRGELTSVELVERCLAQIDRYEPAVCGWVRVDAGGALAAAQQCDAHARQGRLLGPLHGLPLGIKDIIDVASWPTVAGSPRRAAHRALRDATVVARLRAAGAVLLGKTVTTEWACFDPPPTRNPWNLAHTPGGSSSGSAAAVAAGMCPAALGTQTGGSIVRPAAFCGVAACKPTFGRVSRAGVVPVSPHLDHVGPIARCVDDLALLLSVLSGPDPLDSATLGQPDWCDAPPWSEPPRLGLPGDFSSALADGEALAALDRAADCLAGHGARIEPLSTPAPLLQLGPQHRALMARDLAQSLGPEYAREPATFGPRVRELIECGLAVAPAEYQAALASQRALAGAADAWLGGGDALLLPAAAGPAPARLDTTGDPALQAPWSFLGWPVVVLPCQLSSAGLPLAVQLVGRPWAEAQLLALARWCADRLEFSALPPNPAESPPHITAK